MKNNTTAKPKKPLSKLASQALHYNTRVNKLSGGVPKVPVACFVCRRRKIKVCSGACSDEHEVLSIEEPMLTNVIQCDGVRPSCTFCSKSSLPCTYAAAQGLTRTQHLCKENGKLQDFVKELSVTVGRLQASHESMSLVLKALAYQSDSEAAGLLARLRIGHSLKELVELVQGDKNLSASAWNLQPEDEGFESLGISDSGGSSKQSFATAAHTSDTDPSRTPPQMAQHISKSGAVVEEAEALVAS